MYIFLWRWKIQESFTLSNHSLRSTHTLCESYAYIMLLRSSGHTTFIIHEKITLNFSHNSCNCVGKWDLRYLPSTNLNLLLPSKLILTLRLHKEYFSDPNNWTKMRELPNVFFNYRYRGWWLSIGIGTSLMATTALSPTSFSVAMNPSQINLKVTSDLDLALIQIATQGFNI